MASNITPSALNRIIESNRPTLCIDEADRFLNNNAELNGVINAGHTRRTAVRIISDKNLAGKWEAKEFSLWGAQALAGIGDQSDTLMSRSIKIGLRRKYRTETVEPFPHNFFEKSEPLRLAIEEWSAMNKDIPFQQNIHSPVGGSDRASDNWIPLFQIATTFGQIWIDKAKKAYNKMEASNINNDDQSVGLELLSDIDRLIEGLMDDVIPLRNLLNKLINDEDSDWSHCNYGRPISSKGLAKSLRPYGVTPLKKEKLQCIPH